MRAGRRAPLTARTSAPSCICGFFFQAEDGIRDYKVTGVQTCALPILGLAGSMLHDIRDLCEPAMAALSRETEDTAYLVVRSGFEAVCLHRLEGDFPIRTLVLQVGSRRPLGVGAGGLAVLAAIAPEEREAIIERGAPALPAFGKLTDAGLRLACEETARAGVAGIQNRGSLGVTAGGGHLDRKRAG